MSTSRLVDRVADLEAKLAQLKREVAASGYVHARPQAPRVLRWARTVAAGEEDYPAAEDTPNTYPIIFLDGEVAATAGDQTIDWTDRQDASRTVATNPETFVYIYLPVESLIQVWSDRGRWWIHRQLINPQPVTLAANLANGASGTGTLADGRSVDGTAVVGTGNTLKLGTQTAYQFVDNGDWYFTGGTTATGGGGGGSPLIEGKVTSPFTKGTSHFSVEVTHDDSGLLSPGTIVDVRNFSRTWGGNYQFQGEYGAACLFRLDSNDTLYRAVWVECPDHDVSLEYPSMADNLDFIPFLAAQNQAFFY